VEKVSKRRTIRPGRRKSPLRSVRLAQQAALLAAPPRGWPANAFADAPQRLVGEARTQGVLVITFCAAFSLIGLLMMMQGGERIREVRQTEAWRTAQGVVEASDVYVMAGSQGEQWRPHVTYSYAVSGRLIVSTRMSMSKPRLEETREQALAYLARYPVGGSVTVRYNPEDITQSVLDTDTPASAYVNLLFGCALALIGPTLLASFRRTPGLRAHWPVRTDPAVTGG